MANLLAKFRIDYSSLTMVQDITEAPQPETKKMFDEVIKKFTDEAADPGNFTLLCPMKFDFTKLSYFYNFNSK